MASATDIASLRRLIDDVNAPQSYTDQELSDRLDAAGSTNIVASTIWREKAAAASTLVDVSESGSSRKLSEIRKAALENAAYFDGLIVTETLSNRPRTRPITRPSPS